MAISIETLAAARQFTKAYVDHHGGSTPVGKTGIIGTVSLDVNWSGEGPYTQAAAVNGYTVTANTKVDLLPDADLFEQMLEERVDQIYIMNDNGVLTAVAQGFKPERAITCQALFTEVN